MKRDDLWSRSLMTLACLLAAGLGVIATVTIMDDDGNGTPDRITITVAVPEGVTMDADNNVSVREMREQSARPFSVDADAPPLANEGPDIHEDARDETPPGISREEADEALVTPPNVGEPQPPAGAQNYRCEQHLVRNYSPRAAGVKVSMFVLHFTVSRPGSLAVIRGLFNTASFGASSHLLLELDGECEQIVPYTQKAWTQGPYNSSSESVEIVTNDLSRAQWLASPILKNGTLANIVADRLRARGLPPRRVDPEGCTPRAGVTDHAALECGNTHWDVGRNFPWPEFMVQVRSYFSGKPVGDRKARKWCRSLRIVRAKAARDGWTLSYRQRGRALKRLLAREAFACS